MNLIAMAVSLGMADRGVAQVAVSATLTSNYQYRGLTLSDGQPALSVNLAYDHGDGAYLGGSVIGARTDHSGVRLLGHVEYLGYAGRLNDRQSWDVGVTNTQITNYRDMRYKYNYTELYAGLHGKYLNYYVYYSPNYFERGANAIYAELSGALRLERPWRLFGHVGVLTPLGGGDDQASRREQYDLGAGIAADFKGGQVQLAWTVRGPGVAYLAGHEQSREALVLTATHAF